MSKDQRQARGTYVSPFVSGARCAILVFALLMAVLAESASAASATSSQFRITGRGWGHGIGLSQYGAKGFAEAGYTAEQITGYYYQGTTVGEVPTDARFVDVLLKGGLNTVSMRVDDPGATATFGSEQWALEAGDTIVVAADGGNLAVAIKRGSTSFLPPTGSGQFKIDGTAGEVATLFTADSGARNSHWRGDIAVRNDGGFLAVVNSVPIDDYLRGVISAEMPTSWHKEALKAQALAARSYAIAVRKQGWFDLYSDTRSQVYRGIEEEESSTDQAVAETAGKVILSGDSVIPAFFFSTSGGRTAAIDHEWNSDPRPYFVSVPDPYEVSPYSQWSSPVVVSGEAMKAALGSAVQGDLVRVVPKINGSSRVSTVKVFGTAGTGSVKGSDLRTALSLRSTFFRVQQLSIRINGNAGRRTLLSGTITGRGRTWLEGQLPSGEWKRAGRVRPKNNKGFWRRKAGPGFVAYRLWRGDAAGPSVQL